MKPCNLIHKYCSGALQLLTDAVIVATGNIWVTNNSNDLSAPIAKNLDRSIFTKDGGTGTLTVYGIAKPEFNSVGGESRAAPP